MERLNLSEEVKGKPSEKRRQMIAEHKEKERLEQLAKSEITEEATTIAGTRKTLVRQGGKTMLIGGPESRFCEKQGREITEYVYRSTKNGEIELKLPMRQAPQAFTQATTTTTTKPDEPIEHARERLQLLREIVENVKIGRGENPHPLKWNPKTKKWEG